MLEGHPSLPALTIELPRSRPKTLRLWPASPLRHRRRERLFRGHGLALGNDLAHRRVARALRILALAHDARGRVAIARLGAGIDLLRGPLGVEVGFARPGAFGQV